jgi:hypothetical protein
VEHEKKTFFSLLKNTRSGGISQGRASAAAAGGAKRRAFTDDGAEGTARQRGKGPPHLDPLFSTGSPTVTFCFRVKTGFRCFSFSRLIIKWFLLSNL